MNKLFFMFKAGEVLRNITSWFSSMWVFILTIRLPFITGLNEAEESRNDDLDIKEKDKLKVI